MRSFISCWSAGSRPERSSSLSCEHVDLWQLTRSLRLFVWLSRPRERVRRTTNGSLPLLPTRQPFFVIHRNTAARGVVPHVPISASSDNVVTYAYAEATYGDNQSLGPG